MNPKGKQFENEQKSITIKLSVPLKQQLDIRRKKTGESQSKEKLFQIVRDMHRVGAHLTMIASALNLEGLQAFSEDGEWKVADIDKIVTEIKKEQDYLPPSIPCRNNINLG